MSLKDIAAEQKRAFRHSAFYEAYKTLRGSFFGEFKRMAEEIARDPLFKDITLGWKSGRDNHAEIMFKNSGYCIRITAFDHSFNFADGENFWTEASAEHYYISGHSDGKCVYRQVVTKPALPLKLELSEELRKKYPRKGFQRKGRLRAVGDYRFLWQGVEDEDRFKKFLVLVLSGERPQSDFEMVFQKDKNGCFIASAVFGFEAREVAVLRTFRDERLRRSTLGALCIIIYLFVSPSVASLLLRIPVLQKLVRAFLSILVGRLSDAEVAHNPGPQEDG